MQSNLHQLKYTHNIMKFKQVKLSEVANLFAGYPFKGNNYSDKGVRVVRGDNVTIGHLRWTIGKDKRWNEPFDQFEYYSLHENDIVIGMDGSRVGMNRAQIKHEDLPLLLAQRVACIRNNSNSIQDYLYYQIFSNNFVRYIKAIHTGTSIPHVSLKQIGDFEIPLPSLSDQRKIAGILSALDSKIENNNKINANLEAQAQALFKSWFVDFTPFKDQPFVDSELGPIPQGWKVGKLGDYCEVKSGYAFKSSWWTNKGYKIIKIKNISENGDINLNDCSCVLPENCDKAKNFIANTGDIVIAMTGATIGKFNIIPKIDEKFYINQRVGKFFLGEKPIEKVPYIYCFLKQENISTQIIQKGQGSAQPNISGADIESIPMLTPMSIILKYNKMCQPLFEKILSNRLESKKLSALRDTLLPKLMSGEIKL